MPHPKTLMKQVRDTPCENCGHSPSSRYLQGQPYLCGECRYELGKEKEKLQAAACYKGRKMARANGHRCQQCGIDPGPGKLDAHHKIPLSQGGTNDDSNLILLCKDCHKKVHYG